VARYENLAQLPIAETQRVRLGVACDGRQLCFRWAAAETGAWQPVGDPQDALVLSDEFVEQHDPIPTFGFTGAHVGLYSYDITEHALPPAFDWFEYSGRNADET
jgi:beta-xylosidase